MAATTPAHTSRDGRSPASLAAARGRRRRPQCSADLVSPAVSSERGDDRPLLVW
jgi:hypothetical protein